MVGGCPLAGRYRPSRHGDHCRLLGHVHFERRDGIDLGIDKEMTFREQHDDDVVDCFQFESGKSAEKELARRSDRTSLLGSGDDDLAKTRS